MKKKITRDKQSSINDLYSVSKELKDSLGRNYKRNCSKGCGISCEARMGSTPLSILNAKNIFGIWIVSRRVLKEEESHNRILN